VAAERGLDQVRAKDCIFTDLDGDGYLDLCLDRQRIYLSRKGEQFVLDGKAGIDLANHEDPPEACFGLGSATRIERLEVHWPNAVHSAQVFKDLVPDRFLVVVEGSKTLR